MELHKELENVESLERLVRFIRLMAQDKVRVSNEAMGLFGEQGDWQNSSIDNYLDAIAAWAESSVSPGQSPDWKYIATLFYVGKIYE